MATKDVRQIGGKEPSYLWQALYVHWFFFKILFNNDENEARLPTLFEFLCLSAGWFLVLVVAMIVYHVLLWLGVQ